MATPPPPRRHEIVVRVGDAEAPKNLGLQRLHPQRFLVALVVITEEMQHAVNHEVGGVIGRRDALGPRLREHGFAAEDHVAERPGPSRDVAERLAGRKRQHIGWRVLAAPGLVQGPDLIVVGEDDADFIGCRAGWRGLERGERRQRERAVADAASVPKLRPPHHLDVETTGSPAATWARVSHCADPAGAPPRRRRRSGRRVRGGPRRAR